MNNKRFVLVSSWQFFLTIGVVAIIGIVAFYIWGDNLNKYLLAGKMFHTTTATVIKKETIAVDINNGSHSFNNNNQLDNKLDDLQFRIYFKFDNFEQLSETIRMKVWESEQQRVSSEQYRYTIKTKEEFEKTSIGDKLRVSYRPTSDGDIEIANVSR